MKCLIIYFTGTNNTKFLVNKIKERLEQENLYFVETLNIDSTSIKIDLDNFDLIILSYPLSPYHKSISQSFGL